MWTLGSWASCRIWMTHRVCVLEIRLCENRTWILANSTVHQRRTCPLPTMLCCRSSFFSPSQIGIKVSYSKKNLAARSLYEIEEIKPIMVAHSTWEAQIGNYLGHPQLQSSRLAWALLSPVRNRWSIGSYHKLMIIRAGPFTGVSLYWLTSDSSLRIFFPIFWSWIYLQSEDHTV